MVDVIAEPELTKTERELLRSLIVDLRSIRFGSLTLVVHDGWLVELTKTERIRKSRTYQES